MAVSSVFHHPVFVGDLVSFCTELVRIGRISLTVRVVVEVTRPGEQEREAVRVTEAEVVYVAVDEEGRPTPVR